MNSTEYHVDLRQLRQTNMEDMAPNGIMLFTGLFWQSCLHIALLDCINAFGDVVPFYVNELNLINGRRLLIQPNRLIVFDILYWVVYKVHYFMHNIYLLRYINCQRDWQNIYYQILLTVSMCCLIKQIVQLLYHWDERVYISLCVIFVGMWNA